MKFNQTSLLWKAFKDGTLILCLCLFSKTLLSAQPNALDPTFVNGTFTNTGTRVMTIYGSAIQSDGKIIVVGEFTHYNGIARNSIARINVDGNLDTSFDPGIGADAAIYCTAIQSDGKIIIGGDFLTYNGTVRKKYARVNSNGTLDETYHTNSSELRSGAVYCMAIQSNGMVCMGGTMVFSNEFCDKAYIIRLTTLGVIDYGYSDGCTSNFCMCTAKGPVYAMTLQTDGKLIIGGTFTESAGYSRKGIARLAATGLPDNTFNPGAGIVGAVYSLSMQSDGKIIVGGSFSSYNGLSANNIVRMESNGTIDNTFNTGVGFNDNVYTTKVQTDGKVIVGGNFTSYKGSSVLRLVRLQTDGALDPLINPSLGPNKAIRTLSLQSNGRMMIGGEYDSYSLKTKSLLTRLQGSNCNLDVSVSQTNSMLSSNENGASYQWADCNNANSPINGETGKMYSPLFNGSYEVQITKGGCVAASECYTMTATGVDDQIRLKDFIYYPNPTVGDITLEFPVAQQRKVEILNAKGEMISSEKTEDIIIRLHLEGLKGLYFVRVIAGEKAQSIFKIVKE